MLLRGSRQNRSRDLLEPAVAVLRVAVADGCVAVVGADCGLAMHRRTFSLGKTNLCPAQAGGGSVARGGGGRLRGGRGRRPRPGGAPMAAAARCRHFHVRCAGRGGVCGGGGPCAAAAAGRAVRRRRAVRALLRGAAGVPGARAKPQTLPHTVRVLGTTFAADALSGRCYVVLPGSQARVRNPKPYLMQIVSWARRSRPTRRRGTATRCCRCRRRANNLKPACLAPGLAAAGSLLMGPGVLAMLLQSHVNCLCKAPLVSMRM